jgi:hypothetical protein
MFETFKAHLDKINAKYQESSGLIGTLFNFFCGRATFFMLIFAGVGIIQEFRGKLSMAFVALISALQGWVVIHSVKEDWNQQKQSAQATVNVINQVSGPDAKAATPTIPVAAPDPAQTPQG